MGVKMELEDEARKIEGMDRVEADGLAVAAAESPGSPRSYFNEQQQSALAPRQEYVSNIQNGLEIQQPFRVHSMKAEILQYLMNRSREMKSNGSIMRGGSLVQP